MKLRTVGLLWLGLMHMGAQALPSPCLNNYRATLSDGGFDAVKSKMKNKKGIQVIGVGGGLAGMMVCLLRNRSVGGFIVCPLLLGGISYVSYEYAQELEKEIQGAVETAMIAAVVEGAQNPGPGLQTLVNEFLQRVGADNQQNEAVLRALQKAMRDGELCDGTGRPNKSYEQTVQLIKSKI